MTLKYKIENVNKILLANGILFIQSSHKSSEINAIYISDDYYMFTDLQTVYRYSQNLLEVFLAKYNDFFEISNDSNDLRQDLHDKERLLIFNLSNDDVVIYNLIDKKNIDTISFDKDISIFSKNNVIVTEGKSYTNKNIISCWKITDLACKWSYQLPEGFKIFGSVKAIDDVLFFSCTDANLRNSKLIGLKIETGKVLWQFENLIDFQVDFQHKLLRGYQGAYYQVIDPFKGKLLVNKDLKELWDKGIDPTTSNNTITEDKLWFVSGRGESTKFGAINLETSEVDFIQDFPLDDDGQLDKPVFHQDKLYLRDTVMYQS